MHGPVYDDAYLGHMSLLFSIKLTLEFNKGQDSRIGIHNWGNTNRCYIQQSPSNKARPICQEIVATLERWPLARERGIRIQSSRPKNLWLHQRGWPLLRVATKRGTTVGIDIDWNNYKTSFGSDLHTHGVYREMKLWFKILSHLRVIQQYLTSQSDTAISHISE